jgi:D-methionine transport system ATP-binding protein
MDVVMRACDRVAVLDAGRVVEEGAVYEVFTAPVHEVTRKLVLGRFDKELAREVGIRASETSTAPVSRLLRVASARAAMDLAVLGEATWRFGISLRIVSGSVERIRGARYGRLVVEAEGEARAIDEAVNALCASGLDVEALTGEAERGFAVA